MYVIDTVLICVAALGVALHCKYHMVLQPHMVVLIFAVAAVLKLLGRETLEAGLFTVLYCVLLLCCAVRRCTLYGMYVGTVCKLQRNENATRIC